MLIAQVTDIHLGFEQGNPDELNTQRFAKVLERLKTMLPQPDLVLLTGDLIEHGDADSYERLKAMIAMLSMPVYLGLGNHDERGAFAQVFDDVPLDGGFLQYVIERDDVRIIMLDTYEPGRHGGAFCTARAAWLAARLDEAPETPTIIALHHPPVPVGIDWMDAAPDEEWILRLRDTLAGRDQVKAIIAGHLHRPIATSFAGIPMAICASSAPHLALDLRPIDPETPDDRPMILMEPPAFGLHLWRNGQLVSHMEVCSDAAVITGYNEKMQPLVRMLMAEHPRS